MNVLVVADGHYYRDRIGNVYVESVFDYNFYSRYLVTFEKVYAVVRIEEVDDTPSNMKKVSGVNVEFLPLPSTRGIMSYLHNIRRLHHLAKKYVQIAPCGIFRVPGVSANLICKEFERTKKPYAVEVIVDPWEYFAKGTSKGLSRIYARYAWTLYLRKVIKKAVGVSYVTESYLQTKYPCKAIISKDDIYFTEHYSSVDLPDDTFNCPKKYKKIDVMKIVHAANAFTGDGKGHIELMDTVKLITDKGYKVQVCFIGDGPYKSRYNEYAEKLDIKDKVTFTGIMSDSKSVREEMRKNDIFVFPTKAEGLPRVLLEAMAEGLPCISSPVCGIPEILDMEYLIPFSDVKGYADCLIRLINNPDELEIMSKKNIETARKYSNSILKERRKNFYDNLAHVAKDVK